MEAASRSRGAGTAPNTPPSSGMHKDPDQASSPAHSSAVALFFEPISPHEIAIAAKATSSAPPTNYVVCFVRHSNRVAVSFCPPDLDFLPPVWTTD
ncbi:hypothetical protein HPB47_021028 [Ixodes persulcatus]|uniref:Uncharacterized protein n=1 Tax=Ixodes persulcatus TaxID=34615 RepID=A0AC60QGX9_IXOPE|nr:hypothetical protein HPB47_021028 [Ixodes persulcatus]